MDGLAKSPARMTVAEFLPWADATPGRWELVDGEPRPVTPPLNKHALLCAEVSRLLGNHLAEHRPECSLFVEAGVIPSFLAAINMRQPEIVVSCTPSDTEGRGVQAPILIVEILSPSNQAETWSNVWAYTSIDGLHEVLVLRADRVEAMTLRRHGSGGWPSKPDTVTRGDLVLDSVGFRADLATLYRTTRLDR